MTPNIHTRTVVSGLIALAAIASSAGVAFAQPVHNLTQGTDHTTIQEAIDDALDGDDIEVEPGTYLENIDFLDKILTLHSTDPMDGDVVATTIIDGNGLGTVVIMSAGSISGFTITGGGNTGDSAGGVHATGTAVVSYNLIMDNVADEVGGGVAAENAAVVRNNRIVNNASANWTGGVNARHNSLVINNYIAFNSAVSGGGGVRALENCTIRNNTIVFNSSGDTGAFGGGGILAADDARLFNNIVAFSTDGSGIHVAPMSIVEADYNCVFGNFDGEYGGHAVAGPNDLNIDPAFFEDDLHVQASSPCVNAGQPGLRPQPDETDIDDQLRIQNGRVEIGADEIGDCNGNGVPDNVDIEEGTSQDCNDNGIPDDCDIDVGLSEDCNANAIPDACDVAGGTSEDTDENGIPDECEAVRNLTQGETYPDIQSAIDAAFDGDELEVRPGTYVENVDFLDKDIALRSTDPLDPEVVATTIIDGGGLDALNTVVTLSAGVVSGFTITNGNQPSFEAGGVQASGTAVVSYNLIIANAAAEKGGGVTAEDTVVVRNNWIVNNTAINRGGGVNARDNSLIIDNYIAFNVVNSAGGGVRARENSIVRNNTIVFNSSADMGVGLLGGGGVLAEDTSVVLNNIIAFSTDGVGIHVRENGANVTADFNCVFGNSMFQYGGAAVPGPNDVKDDPLLEVDALHLSLASPCIDAGDPELVPLEGEVDIDGEDRVYVGIRVDIGADEAADCDGNGIPDADDIAEGTSLDCNGNEIPDECDVDSGNSEDSDGDGIPDECAVPKFFSSWKADGEGDGVSWDDRDNWIPARVPDNVPVSPECPDPEIPDSCGALYCVSIGPEEAFDVDVPPLFDVTIETLEIGSDVPGEVSELVVLDNRDLTVNQSTTIASGGQVSLGPGASMTGGPITIQSNGLLGTTDTGFDPRFLYADVDNSGTLRVAGNQSLELTAGFELLNQADGVIEVNSGAALTVAGDSVTQEGRINASGGASVVFTSPLTNSSGGIISLTGSSLGITAGLFNECGAEVSLNSAGSQVDGDITNAGLLTLADQATINGNLTVLPCGEISADGNFVITGTGLTLTIEGGLMSLNGEGGDDLIEVDSLQISQNGLVEVGGDVELSILGTVTIEGGGSYQADPDAVEFIEARLTASAVNILSGGAFRLTDSMTAAISGDFTLDGTDSICTEGARGKTPPIAFVPSDFTVDGDLIIMGAGSIIIDPTSDPKGGGLGLLLGGDFRNHSTCPESFDWGNGALTFSGLEGQDQLLESAGEDRGPSGSGFENNFAMGTIELMENSTVTIEDTFDNQQDGDTDCDEVLYVDTLIVRPGATLTTKGCRVYYMTLDNQGSIPELGVNVLQILCDGDANSDGHVDPLDVGFVLSRFGCPVGTGTPGCDAADVNGDGQVDPLDTGFVLARYGVCS